MGSEQRHSVNLLLLNNMLIICAVIGLYASAALAVLPICPKCPEAGHWSRWEDYTSCTESCGLFGRKVQKRRCLSWKWGCPCKGPYSRARPCNPIPCTDGSNACADGYSLYPNYKLKKVLCGNVSLPSDYVKPKCRITKVLNDCAFPNLGIWGPWKSTAPCTATCGLNGMVTQNRTCLSESKGHKCTGPEIRTIHCPKLSCPGDVCALDTRAVTNLVTGDRICGVGLPQDPVLLMPLCTTTTKKATTKTTKTTKKATTKATTKTTMKPTTTTPALPCFTHYASSTKYANCAAVGSGFKAVGGSCYKAIYVNADYAGARAKCKAVHPDADLATIRCDAENTGAQGVVSNTLKTQCASFGEFFHSQLLLGINNVTRATGIAWTNGANTTYRNWAPGEPNGDNPAAVDAASSATLYILSTNPAGGVTYPLGKWENMLPSWVVCAALCEVITAKTGTGCGLRPCPAVTKTTTTKKTTTTTTTTTTTPVLPCVTTSVPTTTYADCAAVGGGFVDVGGSCYQAIFINDSYTGARAKCQALNPNADLATIRCDSENTGVESLVPAALKTQCSSFGEFFHSQLLLGINNVTTTSGVAWSNGANSTYRNWAPGEPNGDNPAAIDAASSATLYILSTNPAGGASYPLGKWENMLPSWVVCAALCEVVTAKTGNGCGFRPCQAPL